MTSIQLNEKIYNLQGSSKKTLTTPKINFEKVYVNLNTESYQEFVLKMNYIVGNNVPIL